MKELYNYTKAWKSPYKFYTFKVSNLKFELKFRNGIKFTTILIATFIYLVFYILNLKYSLKSIFGVSYWIVPALVTYYIVTRNVDGKTLNAFIIDYIKWFYYSKIKKVSYSYDNKILYKEKGIKFR